MFSKFRIMVDDQNSLDLEKYYHYGEQCLTSHKTMLTKTLDQYVDYKNGVIDGDRIEKEWFKEIKADIFLSHSHDDEKLAVGLAGWLKKELGLEAFVDSCVWGYANDILNQINDKFNMIRIEKDGSKTYSHKKANYAASHIYFMLNSALNNMINKTESFMFINTDHSTFYMDQDKATACTLSPWIYSEIVMANTMQRIRPVRPPKVEKRMDQYRVKYERVEIGHRLDFSDFVTIHLGDFKVWKQARTYDEHPLDTLYRIGGRLGTIYETIYE